MKKIEINEGCFGHDVLINDESLFTHEFDNRSPEIVSGLQTSLILKLNEIKDSLGMMDWVAIAEIITSRSNEYEMNNEESKDYDKCDQCGEYGYSLIYYKKDETNL